MAKNIEMNWFNGSGYEVLWPQNGCLSLSGGTMSGSISWENSFYEDGPYAISPRVGGLSLDVGTGNAIKLMVTSEGIELNNNRIFELADPIESQDAATKAYVDGLVGSGGLTYEFNMATSTGGSTMMIKSSFSKLVIAYGYWAYRGDSCFVFSNLTDDATSVGYIIQTDGRLVSSMNTDAGIVNLGLFIDSAIPSNTNVFCLFIGIK